MKLSALLGALEEYRLLGGPDEEVTGLKHDSRQVEPGDLFVVFGEYEKDHEVELVTLSKNELVVKKLTVHEVHTEPQLRVTLFQAIPKKPALFELVVQKATELGVSAIVPMVTERTEKRHGVKLERLRLIATEATEQCGRVRVPEAEDGLP